jgi:YesN/AraC family two-component response regulator
MLTDVVMPKVSGCELAARVASIRPDMKVIFMSGYADSAVAQRGVRPSDGHFLPKPFKTEALVDMIRKVIAERA